MTFDVTKWCEEFYQKPVTEMSREVSEMFLEIVVAEGSGHDNPEAYKEIEQQFSYRVLEAKCQKYNLALNKYVKLFLFTLCNSPGEITMYTVALRHKQHGDTPIDMQQLAYLFPMGFLTDKALSDMWALQKNPLPNACIDNCLDVIGDFK